jgi:hypothetical protein
MKRTQLLILASMFSPLWPLGAQSSGAPSGSLPASLTDWDLGGVLFPNLHLHGVGGITSGDADELASGAHDPRRGAFSAQSVEPALSLRTQYLQAFANHVWFQEVNGDWDGELEEAFGKLTELPGGLELKGGRFLSRFGALNDQHLHAWDFVDAEAANARFLGDEGLMLEGGEISWKLPLGMEPSLVSVLSLGHGHAPAHDHAHEEHEHEEEVPHEGDESVLMDDVWTARAMVRYRWDDFHSITGGASWAGGSNGFGRDSNVYGIDLEWLWRENGLEPGGRAFRWRNEVLWRDVDAFSEHDEDDDGIIDETFSGNFNETGFHTHLIYTWNPKLDSGLRLSRVTGIDDFGQDGRWRISPTLTWWTDETRRIGLRSQYNFDSVDGHRDEHSLWFQLNIALGSTAEVR